jgi:hypothetical protein
MIQRLRLPASLLLIVLLTTACITAPRLPANDDFRPVPPEPHGWAALREDPELVEKILALDPTDIDADDVEILRRGPTPWIFTIAPVHPWAWTFLYLIEFLGEMGYPMDRMGDPRYPKYKIYWRTDGPLIAGMAASFYEQDGMAPMIIGWSGGAIQTVVVLHSLSNTTGEHSIVVRDLRTGEADGRDWILDPVSGERLEISDVQFSLGGALAAGGLGRMVRGPRWEIDHGLRLVPDSVRDFVGFQVPNDVFGSDKPFSSAKKFAAANEFTATGSAKVRSIVGDSSYHHFNTFHCEHLLANPEGRQWVDAYRPDSGYGLRNFLGTEEMKFRRELRNLWCGEIWYAIKKNWAIEAQRVARAIRSEQQPLVASVSPADERGASQNDDGAGQQLR